MQDLKKKKKHSTTCPGHAAKVQHNETKVTASVLAVADSKVKDSKVICSQSAGKASPTILVPRSLTPSTWLEAPFFMISIKRPVTNPGDIKSNVIHARELLDVPALSFMNNLRGL